MSEQAARAAYEIAISRYRVVSNYSIIKCNLEWRMSLHTANLMLCYQRTGIDIDENSHITLFGMPVRFDDRLDEILLVVI